METSTFNKRPPAVAIGKPDYIMANWLEAITKLHGYHQQLVTYINQKVVEPESIGGNTSHIGQCPMSQLITLARSMETELTKLIQDVDQVDRFQPWTTKKKVCDKLVSHTFRLNQLNDQAQTRLYLIRRSAS